jgi:hypothetical protein
LQAVQAVDAGHIRVIGTIFVHLMT